MDNKWICMLPSRYRKTPKRKHFMNSTPFIFKFWFPKKKWTRSVKLEDDMYKTWHQSPGETECSCSCKLVSTDNQVKNTKSNVYFLHNFSCPLQLPNIPLCCRARTTSSPQEQDNSLKNSWHFLTDFFLHFQKNVIAVFLQMQRQTNPKIRKGV